MVLILLTQSGQADYPPTSVWLQSRQFYDSCVTRVSPMAMLLLLASALRPHRKAIDNSLRQPLIFTIGNFHDA